jgi:hypothetical protein
MAKFCRTFKGNSEAHKDAEAEGQHVEEVPHHLRQLLLLLPAILSGLPLCFFHS